MKAAGRVTELQQGQVVMMQEQAWTHQAPRQPASRPAVQVPSGLLLMRLRPGSEGDCCMLN